MKNTEKTEIRGMAAFVLRMMKTGGILLILVCVLMSSGKMNAVSAGILRAPDPQTRPESETEEEETENEAEEDTVYPAPELDLYDQYGKKHKLEDYRGKYIFLNFWATWCPPCRAEMPDIQALYEENSLEEDTDLVILGVAFPGRNQEKDEEGIAEFLYENGYTYPTLMDTGGDLLYDYGITAFPTTYMIDKEGNLFGYVTGSISKETMESIIEQTRKGQKESGDGRSSKD